MSSTFVVTSNKRRGCVKTQKHEIFVGKMTIANIEKIA